MSSLTTALVAISDNPIDLSEQRFNMNSMMDEIEHIQFNERKKTECVNRFQKWCEENPHHSFPKLKRKWITGLASQKRICVLYIRYPVDQVLDVLRRGDKIPSYCRKMYSYVLEYIQDCDSDKILLKDYDMDDLSEGKKQRIQKMYQDLYRRCVIIVHLSGEKCIEYLMERGVLIQRGKRLYRNISMSRQNKRTSLVELSPMTNKRKA